MKQKSRIASKLFAVLVVLTLISCCFLGTTFARYTSSGVGGSATVAAAKWSLSIKSEEETGVESTTVSSTVLSPSDEENSAEGTPRSNTSEKILVAVITNDGQVDAKVTEIGLVKDEATLKEHSTLTDERTKEKGYEVTIGTAPTDMYYADGTPIEAEDYHNSSEDSIIDMFTFDFYYSLGADAVDGSEAFPDDGVVVPVKQGETTNNVLYIYATITWTSDDETCGGTAADKRDTWIATCVTGIEWELYYKAEQVSTVPSASQTSG